MATATAIRTREPWTPPFPVYRFTVDQYHRMIETGILGENDKVELLEGWIVPKLPHNPPHDGTIWLAQTTLLAHLPPQWILRIQSSLTLAESEPEPDLVIARGPGRRYVTSHPKAKDVALVIEVADTTLEFDREVKGRIYAQPPLPVYWVLNLQENILEEYSLPKGGRVPEYKQRRD
jgi:Putative restriction endonuclease